MSETTYIYGKELYTELVSLSKIIVKCTPDLEDLKKIFQYSTNDKSYNNSIID